MPNTKPTTPLHPDANQEIEAPKEIPKELTSALDLEDDDEDNLRLDLVNTQSHNNDYLMDSDDSDGQDGAVNENEVQKDDSLIDAVAPIGEPISPRASRTNTGNDSVSTNFFDMDFESRRTPLNPFGQNTKMSSSEPIRILKKSSGENKIKKLSMSQQSRLISYIDERLMAIQRKFIKYLSAREDPETKTEDKSVQYGLSELMHSLDSVINIIWYSMFKMRFVPFVYHDDVLTEDEREKLGQSNSKQIELEEITSDSLFGQTSYLIRIMGDLVDYTLKFHFQSFQFFIIFFTFLLSLIISFVFLSMNMKTVMMVIFCYRKRIIRMKRILRYLLQKDLLLATLKKSELTPLLVVLSFLLSRSSMSSRKPYWNS